MKYICPLIVVSDIQKSRNFYENILDQKVKFDFGENVTFEGDFAIHLDKHYLSLINSETAHVIAKKSNNFELYFENNKIDEIFSKLQEENVVFVHKLMAQPWGQRVIRFYDPDMHIIEVGESMEAVILRFHKEGYPVHEIAEKSSMPIEFVKKVLQIQ